MSIDERIDELVAKGIPVGEAIARAITEKHASIAATESYAHGGAR